MRHLVTAGKGYEGKTRQDGDIYKIIKLTMIRNQGQVFRAWIYSTLLSYKTCK